MKQSNMHSFTVGRIAEWIVRERFKAGSALPVEQNLCDELGVSRSVVREAVKTLAANGLDSSAIQVELTETALMDDIEHAIQVLGVLKQLGIRISLDDFGTGYSSLYQLRHLPVTEVKIDRSFIDSIGDEGSLAFVAGIVSLGHGLGLRVIAEGVERMNQLTALHSTGCDRLQGYFLGRPVDEESFRDQLTADVLPLFAGIPLSRSIAKSNPATALNG